MPPAVIGGVIAGVGAIGGAAIGASAANSAAKKSAKAAEASAAVQRDIYEQNKGILSPFVESNQQAGQTINALLGIGQTGNVTDWEAYVRGNPDALANWDVVRGSQSDTFGGDIAKFGEYHWRADGSKRDLAPYTTTAQDRTAAANQAFDTFRNSTGYKFRMDQGLNAVNSGYAGAGVIKSGAAMKGINDYAQGMASAEFGNYLNALGNQQGVGLSAGSALAGVGSNYANSLGNIYMQKGQDQANAALLKGQVIGRGINSLAMAGAGIFGQTGGGGGFFSPTTSLQTPSNWSGYGLNPGFA